MDCAIGIARSVQSSTLNWGWWSPLSLYLTPFFLIVTSIKLRSLLREAGSDGDGAEIRRGAAVFARPYLGLLLFIAVVIIGAAIAAAS